MKKRMKKLVSALLVTATFIGLASCSGASGTSTSGENSADTAAENAADQVAAADEMTDVEEVVWDSMVPVTGDMLEEGEYEITVDSSSSMLRIEKCVLTVTAGSMNAVMTMDGTGYRYIVMQPAKDAAVAPDNVYIYPEEDADGNYTLNVPVSGLDEAVYCAVFSDKKEKWYDHTLVFRAKDIPLYAYKEGALTTPADLDLDSGEYTAEVSFEGGSGKASIESPAKISLYGDYCTAHIVWSSPNYDYMIVDGDTYYPANSEGNSEFDIPVAYFDRPVTVLADTTAMSEPHEIEYMLTFDSSTLK